MRHSDREQVVDAEQELVAIDRLGGVVVRTGTERRLEHIAGRVGGEHQLGYEVGGRALGAQRIEERETVEVRHVEIEHHERGLAPERFFSGTRIGEREDAGESGPAKNRRNERDIRRFVVDHQNVGIAHHGIVHVALGLNPGSSGRPFGDIDPGVEPLKRQ